MKTDAIGSEVNYKQLPGLFNINGIVGRGAYEPAVFPDLRSFTDHLDYLGIERSLVYHVEARDLHPVSGNRRLLNEIRDQGLENRLYPVFVITPACFFEEGVVEFLREHLAESKVRALQITPDISRFSLREIERLLAELAEFCPTVLWSCRFQKTPSYRDLEYLAKRFPNVSFVMTQKMWGCFHELLDILWRCPNTYIDISYLHMRDTIELLVKRFGAERVLFGIGQKVHYGASIAALLEAQITPEQREMIAHGNIERLLWLKDATKPRVALSSEREDKKLWATIASGMPIEGVDIIDAHGHTPPFTRGWIFERNNFDTDMDVVLQQMNRLGVRQLITSSEPALFGPPLQGNIDGEEMMSRYGGRFTGYLVYNPRYADEMLPKLDDFFSRDFFVGFKLLPAYWRLSPGDPSFEPVWQYADEHRLPILIHTWNDVDTLTDAVTRYPGAVFLLGHSGGGDAGRLQAEELALAHPNVYLEFCGSFTAGRPFETTLMRIGRERVIYGSDSSAHNMAWELGRYLSLPLPDEELIPGLGDNMRRIMAQRR